MDSEPSLSFDPAGEARSVLQGAVDDYGRLVLSNAPVIEGICEDRLPEWPREASLIVNAAKADVATMFQQQVEGVGADTAVRLTANALASSRLLEPKACVWVVSEFAVALGFPISPNLEPTTPGGTAETPSSIAPLQSTATLMSSDEGPETESRNPQNSVAIPTSEPPESYAPNPPKRSAHLLWVLVGIVVLILVYVGIAAASSLPPFSKGPAPKAVAVKHPAVLHDFNGDGTPDFVAVSDGSGDLEFYPRTSNGFGGGSPVLDEGNFGESPKQLTFKEIVAAGDVTGNGFSDLISQKPDGSLWLIKGDGNGSFFPPEPLNISALSTFGVGDFNGDGIPDLLIVNDQVPGYTGGALQILPGNGHGGFGSPTVVGNGGWDPLQIIGVADFDGDGHNDILARNLKTGKIYLYRGNGAGGFMSDTNYNGFVSNLVLPVSTYPTLFVPGNLEGRKQPDLVAVRSDNQMFEYKGLGKAKFSAKPIPFTPPSPWNPAQTAQVGQ